MSTESKVTTSDAPACRVSRITIGRLHNLGNYEHVRYEITLEVPEGASAGDALMELETVLTDLDPKPPHSAMHVKAAAQNLAKPASEMQDWEMGNIPGWKTTIRENEEWTVKREAARQRLDALGGTVVYTDAKALWED